MKNQCFTWSHDLKSKWKCYLLKKEQSVRAIVEGETITKEERYSVKMPTVRNGYVEFIYISLLFCAKIAVVTRLVSALTHLSAGQETHSQSESPVSHIQES